MPNNRIRDAWEPLVKQVIGDLGKRAGARPIRRELEARAKNWREGGLKVLAGDLPSERTIQRMKDDLLSNPEEFRGYERFSWPESMQQGALPWEASAPALELLGYYNSHGLHGRPSVRLVRWFWHVTTAAPDMPALYTEESHGLGPCRVIAAQLLAAWEAMSNPPLEEKRKLEAYLAWRAAPAHLKEAPYTYEKPPFPEFGLVTYASIPEEEFLAAAMEIFGERMARHIMSWSRETTPEELEASNGDTQG